MKIKLILSIQNQLKKLTNKKFSKSYIKKFIIPIIDHIGSSKNNKFLISGSQGIGKSTILQILKQHLSLFYNKKVLSLSLDDYYLTKKERVVLSKKIHSLLITRGVPGTHDTKILLKNIINFEKSNYPIKLPIFNKLNDDRSNKYRIINRKKNILLLEGWCCGCPPIDKSYLNKNINFIEKKNDSKMKWRNFYNQKLKYEYAKIFKHFNEIIFIKSTSFSNVAKWRFKQEQMMKKEIRDENTMNKRQINEFVQYYEKITKWMIMKMPSVSNIIIHVDSNQKITEIK
tara:strand:- start:2093 stop:2950 length:858 start_codon:yes stop_codon:yes gene_type:complete